MTSKPLQNPDFKALIRRIQAKIVTQGVVFGREDALLRRYTDYYDLPKKIDLTQASKYNK